MSSNDLTLIVALALFAALCLGMILGWLIVRMNRPAPPPPEPEPDEGSLLARVREAEAVRNQAALELETAQEAHQRILVQKDAEIAATMEALGEARRDLEGWRSAYEALAEKTGTRLDG
ncbi:MAG: hypothetical protein AAFR46_08450 [Pseudomonadota bacterium]